MKQQVITDKKITFVIKPHSVVDIITNSSSEIFCTVHSADNLKEIKDYLSALLNRTVDTDDDCDNGEYIAFSLEYGDTDLIISDFIKLLTKVLSDTFGETNFQIRTDIGY